MDTNEKVEEQTRKYVNSIAKSCPSELLGEIARLAKDADPTDYFKERWEIQFWYERLDREGLGEKAKNIADRWVEV